MLLKAQFADLKPSDSSPKAAIQGRQHEGQRRALMQSFNKGIIEAWMVKCTEQTPVKLIALQPAIRNQLAHA